MSKMRRATALTRGLFWFLVIAGTAYYWVTPTLEIRPERRVMWAHAVEWWEGMSGSLLAQHRAGVQVAELEPATGHVLAVRDLRRDVAATNQLLDQLKPGHWLIVSALQLGSIDDAGALASTLGRAGWSGAYEGLSDGGGIVVIGRSQKSGALFLLASQMGTALPVRLTLPSGEHGPDGTRLGRTISLLVEPFD